MVVHQIAFDLGYQCTFAARSCWPSSRARGHRVLYESIFHRLRLRCFQSRNLWLHMKGKTYGMYIDFSEEATGSMGYPKGVQCVSIAAVQGGGRSKFQSPLVTERGSK